MKPALAKVRSLGHERLFVGAILGGVAILIVVLVVMRVSPFVAAKRQAAQGPTNVFRAKPLSLTPESNRMKVNIQAERLRAVITQVADHDFSRWNQIIHGVRLWGVEPREAFVTADSDKWTGPRLLEVICSAEQSQKLFGSAPHVLNRNGLHFAQFEESGEKHPDETLSVLAEIGIPGGHPVQLYNHTTTVSEALRAAVANFVLDQRLDFSTLAFAYYLPPQSTWTNKFGETFSFDDVCEQLCDAPMGQGYCHGCHVMYTLSMVLAADRQHPILSDAVRQNVRLRLRRSIETLQKTQRDDGTWDPLWFDPSKSSLPADYVGSLAVTGHTLEWLAVAPQEELIQAPAMVSHGCEGLTTLLLAAKAASIRANYNAYTHALNALQLWSPEAFLQATDPES